MMLNYSQAFPRHDVCSSVMVRATLPPRPISPQRIPSFPNLLDGLVRRGRLGKWSLMGVIEFRKFFQRLLATGRDPKVILGKFTIDQRSQIENAPTPANSCLRREILIGLLHETEGFVGVERMFHWESRGY